MSRQEPWRGYVKSVVREYPALKRRMETPLPPKITANPGQKAWAAGRDGKAEEILVFAGRSRGKVSRPVEDCVIHDLPPRQQRKLEAVEAAVRRTKERHAHDWPQRLKVIRLVYFDQTHTLAGAAAAIPCHVNTACRYSAEFIRAVAEELDLP